MNDEEIGKKLQELNSRVVQFYQQGKFIEAIKIAQHSVSLSKMLGKNHPDYATSLNNLAMLYQAMGAFDKAEPLMKQALEITKKALGENHPDYATSLNNLAGLYKSMGSYEKAEPLLIQALEIKKKALGENNPSYATSLNNLAGLYESMGSYEKAEPLLIQALKIRKKTLGESHPDYAQSINNLAMLYQAMGAYDKTEPLLIQALKIKKKTLGESHSDYAQSINNLAMLYHSMGAYEKAEPLLIQALKIRKKTLGESHPDYAQSINNLAGLYKSMGAYEKAEPMFLQAMEIWKKALGESHSDYATSLNNLAMLYQAMGAYEKAEPLFIQALDIRKKALGENNPSYATSLNNLAGLYESMGAYDKPESLYQQAMEIWKKVLGEDHPTYATSLNNLAGLYDSMGSYEKAEPLLLQALQIRKNALGKDHPYYADSLNNLAGLYLAIRAYGKAEPLFLEALQIRKKALGEDHPTYATSLNNLAGLYDSMGSYEKAEPLYQQALEIRKKALGEEHPQYAGSLNNLAALYAATDRVDQALDLMTTAVVIDDLMIGQVFSIGSEDQRLAFLSSIRSNTDIFLSLVSRYFPQLPAAVQEAFNLVLKRKAITAEALAAQRDALLGGKYPHMQDRMHHLTFLRRQIAQKTQSGPGEEGVEAYHRQLSEWNAERERLEQDLARQVPEIRLEQQFRTADRTVIAHSLPPGSSLVEFFRYKVFDFSAIPARGDLRWKPARYCAFVLHAGEPDRIALIDLGEAGQIDRFIANYKGKLTGEGRAPAGVAHEERPGILPKFFSNKQNDEGPRSHRDIGAIPGTNLQDFEREDGLSLYSALIAPLREALGNNLQLILAPDSQLNTIPFEVIPAPEGGYLVDRYRIHYVSVGRDVLRFSAQIPGKPDKSMIMASPDFNLKSGMSLKIPASSFVSGRISRDLSRGSWHFPPLPGTLSEGKTLGELLNSRPLLEKDALESKVKSLSSPLIFHIATHGFFLTDQESSPDKRGLFGEIDLGRFSGRGMENPMLRSGLALAGANTWLKHGELPPEAEDGILTAEDVSGLDLTNSSLAVLSACETGMGEVKTGEGVFGLRRAFALAGAKTLVMSLWKVPDLATQELMVDFYRRILAGTPKADAFREAQLELRKKYPDPRDWGAFICQGDPGVLE